MGLRTHVYDCQAAALQAIPAPASVVRPVLFI